MKKYLSYILGICSMQHSYQSRDFRLNPGSLANFLYALEEQSRHFLRSAYITDFDRIFEWKYINEKQH